MVLAATSVPTMPVATHSRLLNQNVIPLSSTISMALTGMTVAIIKNSKHMPLKYEEFGRLPPRPLVSLSLSPRLRPLVSQSMSLERSGFIAYRYSNPQEKNRASVVCAAALSSQCAAGQTQTLRRKSSTITIAPPKVGSKTPVLDRGGHGKPPRDGGGGGGGGGGGQFSGGFFLFGFLLFLSYWKDKESEGEYAEKKRQRFYEFWGRVYQLQ